MTTDGSNKSTPPDSGQPRSLLSMETFPGCPLQVSLMRWAPVNIETDIEKQIRADFAPEDVPNVLAQLEAASSAPRIQRCIVFAARGHRWYFELLCRMAKIDFRDVIKAAEYSTAACSDTQLYDFNLPIQNAQIATPYGTKMPTLRSSGLL